MEDQGKRMMLAIALVFGVMVVSNLLFPPEPPPDTPAPDQQERADGEPGKDEPGPERADQAESAANAVPPASRGEEQRFVFDYPAFRAEFSSYGGALVSWRLKGADFVNHDTEEPIDLAPTGGNERLRSFAVSFPESDIEIPVGSEWKLDKKTDTELDLSWSSEELQVVKHYELHPEWFAVSLTVKVKVLRADKARQNLALALYHYQDPSEEGGQSWTQPVDPTWRPSCLVGDELEVYAAKDVLGKDEVRTGTVGWAGFQQSYFMAALAPAPPDNARIVCTAGAAEVGDTGSLRIDVEYPTVNLDASAPSYERTLVAFYGPKYLDTLESLDTLVGFDPGLDVAVSEDLGMFAFIAKPLLWLLKKLHGIAGNWGVAIILLTLIVMAVTLPWQTKSMRSMRAMAKLKPQIETLQKKYKDDKQRQQVEMMNLYKAHGVNPLAGCLPMLLQMPIWFGLYRALSVAAELYNAEFLWLDDMTSTDPMYILPVLMIVLMFIQTRLQPTTADSTQQKILMYGMPVMFGGLAFVFPAGLTLYICTSTVLRSAHGYWMRHTEKAAEAAKGAAKVSSGEGDDEDESSPSADADSADDGDEPSSAAAGTPKKKKKSGKKKSGKKRRR